MEHTQHLIYDNVFIFLLAGFSGFDLLKRLAAHMQTTVSGLPLKCYLKMAASIARGQKPKFGYCTQNHD